MSYSLDLVAEELPRGHVESVELGGGGEVQSPVVDGIESGDGVVQLFLCRRVPLLVHLHERVLGGEVERGVEREYVKEHERAANGDRMLDAVLPVAAEAGVEHLVLLGVDGVVEVTGVLHGDFLIPPFLAHHLLASEGVESCDVDVHLWERQLERGVAHVLRDIHRRGDAHADAGESRAIGYG